MNLTTAFTFLLHIILSRFFLKMKTCDTRYVGQGTVNIWDLPQCKDVIIYLIATICSLKVNYLSQDLELYLQIPRVSTFFSLERKLFDCVSFLFSSGFSPKSNLSKRSSKAAIYRA